MKNGYNVYIIVQLLMVAIFTGFIQNPASSQTGLPVTVDPEISQDYSAFFSRQKPVFRSYGAELTTRESYFLDVLTSAERQFIEASVDPPALGVVRDLVSPVIFSVGAEDIPRQGVVTASSGRLARISEDTVTWTVMIRSAGADEIRLCFSEGNIPEGVSVNLFSRDGHAFWQRELRGQIGPYGFYTTTTFADYVILQMVIPVGVIGDLKFRIPKIVHAVARYFPDAPLYCYEDANCAYANTYAYISNIRNSTAKLNFIEGGGSYGCTGTLLNDTRAGDQQPFLLTANHCFSSQAAASTLEARFDYATVSCGGSLNPYVILVNGSNLIATNSQSDFTLVLLEENPDGTRVYEGWTTAAVANNETVHSVHHPQGTYQKYSRLQNKTAPAYTCTGTSLTNFHYTQIVQGQTEHGSSGGHIVNATGHVVGQLTGPCYLEDPLDRCDFPSYYNRYGRFDVSYGNNNLQYWLFGGGSSVTMSSSPVSALNYGTINIGSYSNLTVTVTNTGTVPNYLNLEAGTATITGTNPSQFSIIGATSLYLPPNTSGTFTVRFTPTSVGMKTASFNIPHNADNIASPRVITLTGYANPCSDIISLGGGGIANTETFSVSGTGAWYTSTNTPCGSPSEGVEQVYSFVAPVTGIYSIEVTATDADYVNYMWKSGSCASSGWTCIDETNTTGTYGAMSWTAGTTYYILLDDKYTAATTHTFYLFYNPCLNIAPIAGTGSGYSKTFSGGGNGIWYNSTTTPCGNTCTGREQVYSFIPAITGLYSVVVTSAVGGVDYMLKTTCSETGGSCIGQVSIIGTYGSLLLQEGLTYYIVLDDRNTTAGTHIFYVNLEESIGEWKGMVSTDWYNAANWCLNIVPDATIDAIVNTPYTYYPAIASGDAYCNNISIGPGAKILMSGGDLNVTGSMTIDGQLELINASSDVDITGDIVWNAGSTANFTANGRIYLNGDWEFRSGANANLANGYVYFEGSTGYTYIRNYDSDCSFKNVLINKTAGEVYYSSSSTEAMTINGYLYIYSDNKFYINTNSPLVLKGQFYNFGHITCAYGTFIFMGGAQNINLNTGDYFNNLVINPTSTVTLQDSLRVHEDLTITSGSLISGSYPILIGRNWNNNVGSSGFDEGTGKVVFNGGNYHQVCSNETFYTLEVDKPLGGAFRMDGANVVCTNYDWTAGAVDVLSGSFTANDLADNAIAGNFYLNSGGTINLYNTDGWVDLTGFLYIYGGNFNVYGGSGSDSYWPYYTDAGVTMSGGVLDFKNVGIYIWNTPAYNFTENITNGTIRTSRGFAGGRAEFTPAGGTLEFYGPTDGNFHTANGAYVRNVLINKGVSDDSETQSASLVSDRETSTVTDAPLTNTVNVIGLTDINGNVTIQNGILTAGPITMYVEGNWNNLAGAAGFVEGTSTVEFNGALDADILHAETFYNLNLNKTYALFDGLELFYDVTVSNDLHLIDGVMELNSPGDLFVAGNLTIENGAGLNGNDAYGPQIYIGKNWTNANTSYSTENGFDPGVYSTVNFNGSAAEQSLFTGCTSEAFSTLAVDKSAGKFRPYNNIQCYRDILITNGSWEDATSGLSHGVWRNFTVASTGAYLTSLVNNTLEFNGSLMSTLTYSGASGYFRHLLINKAPGNSVTQATGASCQNSGNFTVNTGTYNLNGNFLSVFGNVSVNSGGTLSLPASSTLVLTDTKSLNVNTGGFLSVLGTAVNPVTIRANVSTYRYTLNINTGATIAAEYCNFRNTGANGVYVAPGSTVDPAHTFNGCTFQDGAAGGTMLALNNSQVMTIRNAVFPTNTWGGNSNVAKTLNTGHVYFVDFSGGFSGEGNDADGWNLIDWVPTLTATATATPSTICAGASSQLYVNRSGGLGPFIYLWSPSTGLSSPNIINPFATPAGTTTYYVTVTDNLGTQTTSSILITVDPVLPVSVSITASANPSPPGNLVTFTATPVNGGALPSYQWKVNEVNDGTGLPTFSYVPSNNNQVKCILTSNYHCPTGNPATSNIITMVIVNTNTTAFGTLSSGTTVCYDASNTITVAGPAGPFVVQSGGIARMIAGMKISYLYGTSVLPGGYLHGWITKTNAYCGSLPPAMVAVATGEDEPITGITPELGQFTIYPNPATGTFTLISKSLIVPGEVQVGIYNLQGSIMLRTVYTGERSHLFNITGFSPGLYFVKVKTAGQIESFKLIVIR